MLLWPVIQIFLYKEDSFITFLKIFRSCSGSHGLWCRHGQVQEQHHTQPVMKMAQKWNQETLVTKIWILKGVDPKFLRNMHFVKKHRNAWRRRRQTTWRSWVHMLRLSMPSSRPRRSSPRSQRAAAVNSNHLAYIPSPQVQETYSCSHCQRSQALLAKG